MRWQVAALAAILTQPACAQQMMRTLERGPVGYLHGEVLTQQVGNLTGGDFSHPAAADWDGDGDLDLIVGSGYGDLLFFRRVEPTLFAPAQALLPEPEMSLDAAPKRQQASPWLGDWDGDGDLDLLLGLGDEVFHYSVTAGAASGGASLVRAADTQQLQGPLAPCAMDLNGDGHLDLVLTDGAGQLWALIVGSEGECGPPQMLAMGGEVVKVAPPARPWAGDWNGDGRVDLIVGDADGRLVLCAGTAEGAAAPQIIGGSGSRWLPGGLDMRCAAPWLCDWNGDGDMDVLLGCRRGFVTLVERTGPLALRSLGYLQQSQAPVDAGRCAVATCGDWNGDGDADVVVGGEDGCVTLYERLPGQGIVLARGQLLLGDAGLVMAQAHREGDYLRYAWPAVVDWDGDGDLDLLVGSGSGRVLLFENAGGLRARGPIHVGGRALRLRGVATPAPYDYNSDGDVDLFVGARRRPEESREAGELWLPAISPGCAYFENTADATGQMPTFAKGVPIAMCLAAAGAPAEHRDADFLQPYATYPARWRGGPTLDFITVTEYGTFAFENIARPGAYAHLHLLSGNGLPPPLLPPIYSCVPAELRPGQVGLLAADAPYGFVCHYPREIFRD